MLLAFLLTLAGGALLGALLGARTERVRANAELAETRSWARNERTARLAAEARVRELKRDVGDLEDFIVTFAPRPRHDAEVRERLRKKLFAPVDADTNCIAAKIEARFTGGAPGNVEGS